MQTNACTERILCQHQRLRLCETVQNWTQWLLYLISSLIPGLFFAKQWIDGRTHEKYGLVSIAELIVHMHEIIRVLICIKLNNIIITSIP